MAANSEEIEANDDDTEPLPELSSYQGFNWGKIAAANPPRPEPVPEPPAFVPPGPSRQPQPAHPASAPFTFPGGGSCRTHRSNRKAVLGVTAAVVAVLVIGAVIVWLVRSPDSEAPAQQADSTTSTTPTRDAAAEARLLALLPKGYAAGTCIPGDAPKGAAAQINCGGNTDQGGPPSASYTLATDKAALKSLFDDVVTDTTTVNCPGNIQSPGAWRRNATPDQVSGTLFCGLKQDRATVAWTDDAKLMLATARSQPPGPNLDQVYAWWSMHS